MIENAVILAGGFGTRLSHVLGNVPKPMAPVYGKPFLIYLLDKLIDAGVRHVVLATGYMHSVVESYFGGSYRSLQLRYSCESTPLLTGGAIVKAARMIDADDFLVLNGDTLFCVDFKRFAALHVERHSKLTVALRHVDDTSRYGAVECGNGIITAFCEKQNSGGEGVINGGIYAINKPWLISLPLPEKFSFEQALLQPLAPQRLFHAQVFDDYFIDIGVPDDYFRAQSEFRSLFPPDKYLFLDRDGVLNKRIVGGYVLAWRQWEWLPEVLPAIARLSGRYDRLFVVTNQQCVGKQLLTDQQLDRIHSHMLSDIGSAGGRIDKVYVCPDLQSSGSPDRKPQTGMARHARRDFPEVEMWQSVMIGDSLSDMQFGYNAGMRCVFLSPPEGVPQQVRDYTDIVIPSLRHWQP